MAKGWSEMRLRLGEYVSQVRSPYLTLEQQGRLALAWPTMWLSGDESEEGWRRALGYTDEEWSLHGQGMYRVFSEVLTDRERPGYALPFMRDERDRQRQFAEQQSAKGRASSTKRNHGQPRLDSVEPNPTTVNHAVAVAVAVEPENQSLLSIEDGRERENGTTARPKRTKTYRSPRDVEWAESFAGFWEEYPRRQKRPEAERAWMKLPLRGKEGFDQVLLGLYRWQASEQWKDPQYVPLPATWLNAHQYEDDIPEVSSAS